jgi:TM2 domain-containing membrane protein YozV
MGAEFAEVVKEAIKSWPKTLRLCLIFVVAATITIYFYLMGVPVLPGLMR